MSHIFMSYSRQDSAFVEKLMAELAEHGFNTWRDLDNIGGGAAWRAAISKAIRGCEIFLVVLSPRSVASKSVVKELSLADEHRRPIVPVRYEEFESLPEIEYQLSGLQWVDFSKIPYGKALADLVKALHVEREGLQSLSRFKVASPAASAPPELPRAKPSPPEAPTPPELPRAKPSAPEAPTHGGFTFCIHCGTKLVPQNRFCNGCGRPIS